MRWQKIILFVLIAISLSCARVVMPPGGPEDKTAPEVLASFPENYNIQFYSDKIVINFDEYVVLKDFNSEFVSSPLFNEKPDKILKGKSLVMKFDKDSLAPNTTYTLDFGNSIVDFRAGNKLDRYQYVFSTGDVIDSLHIGGQVLLAEDLSPQEKIWVLLYKDYNDSIAKHQKPDFIAKTDENGYYSINNIAAGTYSMFALMDVNNNYMFDLPNEQIAFMDSVFVLSIEEIVHNNLGLDSLSLDSLSLDSLIMDSLILDSLSIDSINTDSLNLALDTISLVPELMDSLLSPMDSVQLATDDTLGIHNDSLEVHRHYKVYPEFIELLLFSEVFINSYLSDFQRPKADLLRLTFSEKQDSAIQFSFASGHMDKWIVEPSLNKDTFNIWIIDTAMAHQDSLIMYLDYYKTDTTQNLVRSVDTLAFNYTEKVVHKTRKQKKAEEEDTLTVKKEYVSLSANFIEQVPFGFYQKAKFNLGFPIDSVQPSKIQFYEKVDTVFNAIEFQLNKDSLSPRGYVLDTELKENTEYKVFVEPDAFIDYRGLGNDTLEQEFRTSRLDIYSEILFEVKGLDSLQVIIQLFNQNNKIVEEVLLTEDQQLSFKYLKPGKYTVKLIEDDNRNGIWDTGNYALKLQAEKVKFFHETIETKANWTNELVWNLSNAHEVTPED